MMKEPSRYCSVETRLAIIGPYPPPYGGVTIHLQRLRTLLVDHNIPFIIYNAGTASTESDGSVISVKRKRSLWMLGYSLFGKERTVYLHAPRIEAFCASYYMARFRAKTVMICLHNGRTISQFVRCRFGRWVLRTLFAPLQVVICVNREMQSLLISAGVDRGRLHYCPAFLPPSLSPKYEDPPEPEIVQFCREHRPLLAANGRVAWYQGEDLYGFDLLIELAKRLKDYCNIGIVICLSKPDARGERYLASLKKRADELDVSSNILVWTQEGPFCPVLRLADALLRPTNTDGDAISVREALYLGVPVVASDVVERPRGVVTFENRNLDDLEAKVRAIMKRIGQNRRMPREYMCQETDGGLDVYLGLIRGQCEPSPLSNETP